VAYVSAGKCSAKVIFIGEYEKFEGIIFTILVSSVFNLLKPTGYMMHQQV